MPTDSQTRELNEEAQQLKDQSSQIHQQLQRLKEQSRDINSSQARLLEDLRGGSLPARTDRMGSDAQAILACCEAVRMTCSVSGKVLLRPFQPTPERTQRLFLRLRDELERRGAKLPDGPSTGG